MMCRYVGGCMARSPVGNFVVVVMVMVMVLRNLSPAVWNVIPQLQLRYILEIHCSDTYGPDTLGNVGCN